MHHALGERAIDEAPTIDAIVLPGPLAVRFAVECLEDLRERIRLEENRPGYDEGGSGGGGAIHPFTNTVSLFPRPAGRTDRGIMHGHAPPPQQYSPVEKTGGWMKNIPDQLLHWGRSVVHGIKNTGRDFVIPLFQRLGRTTTPPLLPLTKGGIPPVPPAPALKFVP